MSPVCSGGDFGCVADARLVWIVSSEGALPAAIGILHVQGTPFSELSVQDFMHPISAYTRTNFLTAKAVPRYMAKQGLGVILTLSTPGARLTEVGFLGNGVASAAIEAFSRILAGELGPSSIRVVCLWPDAIPEAVSTSHTGENFSGLAELGGTVRSPRQ